LSQASMRGAAAPISVSAIISSRKELEGPYQFLQPLCCCHGVPAAFFTADTILV
jgi:hypothetical protein